MPEGHTIHLFANQHRRMLAKRRVEVSSPQGRFTAGAKIVSGHVLKNVWAYGKNLFYEFDHGKTIHVHLGLHGKFTVHALEKNESVPEPRGAVRMRIISDKTAVDLNGPITCAVIDAAGVRKVLDRLGPDVLDPKADAEAVWTKIAKTAKPIGLVLMDQTVVCGIGNAYRCELLYRQRLHPLLPSKTLSRERFDAIWKDAVHLLKMGVRRKQAWAVDETDVKHPPTIDGKPDRYNVYRRATCRGCGTKIKVLPLGGRRCHFCPKEQRLSKSIRGVSARPGN